MILTKLIALEFMNLNVNVNPHTSEEQLGNSNKDIMNTIIVSYIIILINLHLQLT